MTSTPVTINLMHLHLFFEKRRSVPEFALPPV